MGVEYGDKSWFVVEIQAAFALRRGALVSGPRGKILVAYWLAVGSGLP